MNRPLGTWSPVVIAFVACLLGLAARGAAQPKLDLLGDPLPEGAIARCGTVRFLPRNVAWAVSLSPDGKTVAVGNMPGSWPAECVELWDMPRPGQSPRWRPAAPTFLLWPGPRRPKVGGRPRLSRGNLRRFRGQTPGHTAETEPRESLWLVDPLVVGRPAAGLAFQWWRNLRLGRAVGSHPAVGRL